ncbi:protein SCO1/2 [Bradyrhizobium erythrophlei]|jgi:cytochrome oxidase Cu insertion factor (SCO1/SenC/PrrC family)|nr:protein SCO1/2 [Bradyrhizobium erythrophlei]
MMFRAACRVGVSLWLMLAPACAGDAPARSPAEIMDILMWNREPVGGPFELTDHTGHVRTNNDFRGKLMLVYFGFTYCPDVCPTDLQAIGLALDKLGKDGESVQPLFITVDRARDTAEHLAQYVPMFHPRLIGLTGSAEAIRKAADAYKVYYAKVSLGKAADDYTVDHTAFIYLMDRDGNYLGFFPPGTSADRMVEIIRPRLADPAR